MSKHSNDLAERVKDAIRDPGRPPLEKWHPPLSGEMDMRIARNGEWVYKGEPIKRESIVRLFASILRREDDGEFYLVTPVEKWRIQVEDTPLLAHSLRAKGEGEEQVLTVETNTGETLTLGSAHTLVVGTYGDSDEPRPVVTVRHGVEARLVTSAFYDLAGYVVERKKVSGEVLGVLSDGVFFEIARGG
ncbi:DUF1285 domain-containing protein [Marinobacter sp. chi1]|uniref:DUF1285 domain-containing protein n=1 Tax=Marinobacter suaedae TaxID=3057675 RepID=A0ABT8W208_9GAMM|nr:DUF1285 domain-containing protein [Marinobacter sp. chi1]MDO3722260.1 DUF1285 domain-containing protein [Marinobacter sp. chi1]